MKNRNLAALPRRYLLIIVGACLASLVLSPPLLRTEQATGTSGVAGIPKVASRDQLTIRLAQTFGAGNVGVAVKDLSSGETFNLGEDREFDAASTMKLVIVAYMYHEASNNQFDLDEVLTIPAGDVQRYGTGNIQYQPGPYRYSYRDLARLMIQQSDNTAAYVLAQKLDTAKLQQFADEQGLSDTSIEQNRTTPADILKLLDRLYSGQLADSALTRDLLDVLARSDFEDRLPARLPDGVTVYHKTGDAFGGGLHDAGIVVYGDTVYAVAIFTEELGQKERAAAKIADASRDVFSYQINKR